MERIDSLSDRLVRVETTLMHLEHDFEQLHEVVLSQNRQVEDLRRSLERLQSLLDQEGPSEVRDPAAEKPPHY
jgi:SlyX protein